MSTRKRTRGWMAAAAMALHTGLASHAVAGETAGALAPRVRLREMSAASAVRRALDGAKRKMRDPRCQQVLSDFEDLQGRPLDAVLGAADLSAEAHLARIFFYDGSELPLCATQGVLGGTQPGSQVVFICAASFARKHRANPYEAENLILHEMLHTLGLGENPPDPSEIRARIASRCGQ